MIKDKICEYTIWLEDYIDRSIEECDTVDTLAVRFTNLKDASNDVLYNELFTDFAGGNYSNDKDYSAGQSYDYEGSEDGADQEDIKKIMRFEL